MNNRHTQSVLLPPVLAASAVFSLLTLPFFFYQSQTVDALLLGRELQPILTSQNRDLTIRYLGGSIVVSVATGIAMVEIQRRRQVGQTEAAVRLPAQHYPTVAQSPLDFVAELTESHPVALEETIQWTVKSEQASLLSQAERSAVSEVVLEAEVPAPLLTPLDSNNLSDPSCGPIVELIGEYSICRIWVNSMRRRLFALQIGEQYYGFFRLLPTQAAAMETARQLKCRQHHIIITSVEQQYAVWVWEPDAQLESASVPADV